MKWQYRKQSILRVLLGLCCSFVLLINTSISGYCNTETNSGANNPIDWMLDVAELLEGGYMIPISKIFSLPYVAWNYSMDITVGAYKTWLETNHPEIYDFVFGDGENKAKAIGHGGGGYSRLSDKVNYSQSIDIPPEVADTIVQYIQYYVTEVEPLSYKECYLASYNFLNADLFSNYAQFNAVKEFIKNQNGYVLTYAMYTAGSYTVYACVIPKSMDVGFYGTTTSGIFTNVSVAVNWQVSQTPWLIFNEVDLYSINPDGSTIKWTSGYYPSVAGLQNLTNIPTSGQKWNVFSNTSKSELIYVFDTLNAYKNYNAGVPQPYYLTQAGSDTPTWTVGSGTINTGEMKNVGNVYNNIVNNTQTGMTPEEVQKLIETILDKFIKNGGQIGDDGGGSNDGDGSDFDLGFLGTIGRLIGSLISGIGELITGIVGGIVDTILSLIDMITGENGIISKLTNLFDTNIGGFLTSIFDWLPPEIVTLWSAGIILALLFGILRIIRG